MHLVKKKWNNNYSVVIKFTQIKIEQMNTEDKIKRNENVQYKHSDMFDLSMSNKEEEFVKQGLKDNFDVTIDIAQVLSEFPYISSVIKLGLLYGKYSELRFVKKLAAFLKSDVDIPKDKKQSFLNKLSPKDRKKIRDYIVQYLLRAEDDEKAKLMGYVYKERVLGNIENDMFLRLCSIIDRTFLDDLQQLPNYKDANEEYTIEANNFVNLGLIDNEMGGSWKNSPTYELNDVGQKLYEILNENHWFDIVNH